MTVQYAEESKRHLIPINSVQEFPDNPRRGDVKVLRESILHNGFYGVLIAQRSTGNVLVGNHRLRVLRELGETEVPVMFVDATDEDARRIVLGDNRTSDLAFYDDPSLFKLLEQLDGDFTGTGFDRASYELLLQGMEGDSILGGVAQGWVPEERESAYLDSDIRSIVCPYSGDEYDMVAGNLQTLRQALNLDTNAECVRVLADYAVNRLDELSRWVES